MDSELNVLGIEDVDVDVNVLLLFVIDSQPEMQAELCQGWVFGDDGVVVQCGKSFPIGTAPCKRRDHFFNCVVRTEQWAKEGFRLGMPDPTAEKLKTERESAHKAYRYKGPKQPLRSERQAYSNAKMRCIDPENRCFRRYGGRGIEFHFAAFEEFIRSEEH